MRVNEYVQARIQKEERALSSVLNEVAIGSDDWQVSASGPRNKGTIGRWVFSVNARGRS